VEAIRVGHSRAIGPPAEIHAIGVHRSGRQFESDEMIDRCSIDILKVRSKVICQRWRGEVAVSFPKAISRLGLSILTNSDRSSSPAFLSFKVCGRLVNG